MKRKNNYISNLFENMTDEEATELIVKTTEEEYYINIFGIDYTNNKKYYLLKNDIN